MQNCKIWTTVTKKSGIIFSFCNQTLITSKRSRPPSWSKSVTVYALWSGATLQNMKKICNLLSCHVEQVHFEGQGSNFCKPEFFQPFFSQLHKLCLKLRWLIFCAFIQAYSYEPHNPKSLDLLRRLVSSRNVKKPRAAVGKASDFFY